MLRVDWSLDEREFRKKMDANLNHRDGVCGSQIRSVDTSDKDSHLFKPSKDESY